jgi:hypothetical protein
VITEMEARQALHQVQICARQSEVPASAQASGRLPSLRLLRRRVGTLQITAQDLEGLATFGELQHLAKARYRRLVKRYHPDAMHSCYHPHRERGYRFQRITATYQWLSTFPAASALPGPPVLPTLRSATPPIAEMALPFALERKPIPLPDGFSEIPLLRAP